MEHRWHSNWEGNPKIEPGIKLPIVTLSTSNPTWAVLGLNPGLRHKKQTLNYLRYDTRSHTHICICVYMLLSSHLHFLCHVACLICGIFSLRRTADSILYETDSSSIIRQLLQYVYRSFYKYTQNESFPLLWQSFLY
jgi:hypothetical protein